MANFESTYTPSTSNDPGLAVVIYGINPIPGQLDHTVAVLAETNNVFTYTYGNEVILGGDPSLLPELIGDIHKDVLDKSSATDPERIRIAGASLGVCVGYNLQQLLGVQQLPGLYTSAGCNIARNVMYNPIFHRARKAYVQAGHTLDDLDTAWANIDMRANKPGRAPLVCAINRLDPVVPYPFANRNLKRWQEAGTRVRVLRSTSPVFERTVLHTASINRFDRNIREIIEISKSI
jgi:hypothetical protein